MQSCCAHRVVLLLGGLALITSCTPMTRESTSSTEASGRAGASTPASQTEISRLPGAEPAKPASAASAELALEPAEVSLALAFKPGQVTTYRVTSGWQRLVTVRGAPRGQMDEVTGGSTGNGTQMTFTQRVQQVDPNGQALLEVRIDALKVLAQQVGDPVVDFNSARTDDANKPLARLIGQTYQIEMGPDGRVNRIVSVEEARKALAGDEATPDGQTAAQLLSDDAIGERHTVSALPPGGGLRKSGQSWSQVKTLSFFTMGSKAFEKVYTFKGIRKVEGRSLAVIDLEGVLSSKGADEAFAQDDKTKALASTFNMTFTYTGRCGMDLTDGQLEASDETLDVQWLALDPKAKVGPGEQEPNSLMLRSTHVWHVQRVTPASAAQAPAPASTPPAAAAPSGPEGRDKVRLGLQFQEGKALEYAFSSIRTTQIQWDPNRAAVRADPNNTSEMVEGLDLAMSYTPTRVDPNGMTTITAQCRSATVKRTQLGGALDTRPDAAEGLKGKTFTLTVDRTGRIRDANSLDSLLKEIGKLPFREDPKQGRIKDPEMISDLVATQWFLWDAISSADANGVSKGQTWQSRLSLPTPMVMRKARDVTYTLEGIEKTAAGRVALITSQVRLSDRPAPASWPIPYSGRFRVSGPFGFLGGYQIGSFEGKGTERFDLDAGTSRGYEQQFRVEMQAAAPMGLNVHPRIIIQHTIRMEQVEK